MEAWRKSLNQSPAAGSGETIEREISARRRVNGLVDPCRAGDQGEEQDTDLRVGHPGDVIPRRPGAPIETPRSDSFWNSHLFWKGILIGLLSVILVKTAIAVQAPQGIDWYSF